MFGEGCNTVVMYIMDQLLNCIGKRIKLFSLFSEMLTATFRGRPLNGKIERVPSGYTGLSMQK